MLTYQAGGERPHDSDQGAQEYRRHSRIFQYLVISRFFRHCVIHHQESQDYSSSPRSFQGLGWVPSPSSARGTGAVGITQDMEYAHLKAGNFLRARLSDFTVLPAFPSCPTVLKGSLPAKQEW